MKISAQEEYGLRILLQIANAKGSLSITEISELEGLSTANTAKMCRLLRMSGYIKSIKGKDGGYSLAMIPEEIQLDALMKNLDNPLYGDEFCDRFCEEGQSCIHSVDCSIRTVWVKTQSAVDSVLSQMTLADLVKP